MSLCYKVEDQKVLCFQRFVLRFFPQTLLYWHSLLFFLAALRWLSSFLSAAVWWERTRSLHCAKVTRNSFQTCGTRTGKLTCPTLTSEQFSTFTSKKHLPITEKKKPNLILNLMHQSCCDALVSCIFCRSPYVVPTNLFQGIKAVNPMFRGYSQQVGHWWQHNISASVYQSSSSLLSPVISLYSRSKTSLCPAHIPQLFETTATSSSIPQILALNLSKLLDLIQGGAQKK